MAITRFSDFARRSKKGTLAATALLGATLLFAPVGCVSNEPIEETELPEGYADWDEYEKAQRELDRTYYDEERDRLWMNQSGSNTGLPR